MQPVNETTKRGKRNVSEAKCQNANINKMKIVSMTEMRFQGRKRNDNERQKYEKWVYI